MKVKNVSARLHHVGNVSIAPGEEKEIPKAFETAINKDELVEVKPAAPAPAPKPVVPAPAAKPAAPAPAPKPVVPKPGTPVAPAAPAPAAQ